MRGYKHSLYLFRDGYVITMNLSVRYMHNLFKYIHGMYVRNTMTGMQSRINTCISRYNNMISAMLMGRRQQSSASSSGEEEDGVPVKPVLQDYEEGDHDIDIDKYEMAWENFHESSMRIVKRENKGLQRKVAKYEKAIENMNTKLEEAKRAAVTRTINAVNRQEEVDDKVWSSVYDYTRHVVFCLHKFVTSQAYIDDYGPKGSPGQMVMSHFKVADERKAAWWQVYKAAAEEGIAYQRQSAQTLIGKKYKGK